MLQSNNTIKGSLGFNKSTVGFFFGVIGIIVILVQIITSLIEDGYTQFYREFDFKLPLIIFPYALIFLFAVSTENYIFNFNENSMLIKSYFLGKEKEYQYMKILKIDVYGANLENSNYYPKLSSIRIDVLYIVNDKIVVKKYRLYNFSKEDIRKLILKFRKLSIKYNYESDPRLNLF